MISMLIMNTFRGEDKLLINAIYDQINPSGKKGDLWEKHLCSVDGIKQVVNKPMETGGILQFGPNGTYCWLALISV